MMPPIVRTGTFYIRRLAQALAAVPSMARAILSFDGPAEAATRVSITLPAGTSQADIDAINNILATHDPTPPGADPDATRPPIPQALLAKVRDGQPLSNAEQTNYNRWILAALRYLLRLVTGSAE